MRIGLLVTSVGSFGNKGFYNLQEVGLGKALGALGHYVEIYKCVSKDKAGTVETVAPNVRLHPVGVMTVSSNALFSCTAVLAPDLDVLVFMSDIQISAIGVARWAKRHGILFLPYVGTTGSTGASPVKRWIMNRLADIIFRAYKNTSVLVKTTAVKKELNRRGIKDVDVAPVGLDFDLMQKDYHVPKDELKASLGLNPEAKYILMVGRIESDRDPLDVVPVFEKLHRHDGTFRLLVIGNGSLENALKDALERRGLKEYALFVPQVSNSRMWKYYRAAEALVSFSRTEIFGMSILEAMYYELPVYVMHAPGPDDIILNGKTGWLFSSPMEMADAVAEDRGSETGKMAHRRVTEFFSWSSMTKAVVGKAEAAGLPAEMKIHKGK